MRRLISLLALCVILPMAASGCVAETVGPPPDGEIVPEGDAEEGVLAAARAADGPVDATANGTATISLAAGGVHRGRDARLELPPGIPLRLSLTLEWQATVSTAETLNYRLYAGNPLDDGRLLITGSGRSPLVVEVPEDALPSSTLTGFYVMASAERTGAAVDQSVAVQLAAVIAPVASVKTDAGE